MRNDESHTPKTHSVFGEPRGGNLFCALRKKATEIPHLALACKSVAFLIPH